MSPQWISAKTATSVPWAETSRKGSGGALRSTVQTLNSSGASAVKLCRAQDLAGLGERIEH